MPTDRSTPASPPTSTAVRTSRRLPYRPTAGSGWEASSAPIDGRDARRIARLMPTGSLDLTLRSISNRPGWSPRRRAPAGWQADHRRKLLRSGRRACRHRQTAPADRADDGARQDVAAVWRGDERRGAAVADGGAGGAADADRRRHSDVDGDADPALAAGEPGVGQWVGESVDQRRVGGRIAGWWDGGWCDHVVLCRRVKFDRADQRDPDAFPQRDVGQSVRHRGHADGQPDRRDGRGARSPGGRSTTSKWRA